jgi:uncharacterized protein YndB with AHSA1/START domain
MNSRSAPRAVADVSDGLILASVDIDVPPERVFRALASEEITKWWGSADTYRTTRWSGDVRVGGAWRTEGVGADGKAFAVGGEYLEVDPPRKLVHTWRADWDGSHVTTVSYRLQAIETGTRLTLRHSGFGDRVSACEDHTQGWERVLGWLRGHFASAS